MRVGGNAFRDSVIYPAASFLPGVVPTDAHQLNRQENYQIDSAIPQHHVGFNGILDLPFGRGKTFLRGANRFLDELVGGYQLAGSGSVLSQYFQPVNPSSATSYNWGATSPIQLYKKKYKVTDCSSGKCYPGYLWYNGYISPLLTSNPCGASLIGGVPAGETPTQSPIDTNAGSISCVNGKAVASNPNYLTNNVTVPLNNGKTTVTGYSPGPTGYGVNPYSHTFLHGPYNWEADLSLFKVFPITESTSLRINVDAFNAFNHQGATNPNSVTGIAYYTPGATSSYNTPRQLQFTARFTF
jgi:hypothetical protein